MSQTTRLEIKGISPTITVNGDTQELNFDEIISKATFRLQNQLDSESENTPYVISEYVFPNGSGYRFVAKKVNAQKTFELYTFDDVNVFPGTLLWSAEQQSTNVDFSNINNWPGTPSTWHGNPLFINSSGNVADPLAADYLFLLASNSDISDFSIKKGSVTLCPSTTAGSFISVPGLETTNSFHIAAKRQNSSSVAVTSGIGLDGSKVVIFGADNPSTTPVLKVQQTSSSNPQLSVGALNTEISASTGVSITAPTLTCSNATKSEFTTSNFAVKTSSSTTAMSVTSANTAVTATSSANITAPTLASTNTTKAEFTTPSFVVKPTSSSTALSVNKDLSTFYTPLAATQPVLRDQLTTKKFVHDLILQTTKQFYWKYWTLSNIGTDYSCISYSQKNNSFYLLPKNTNYVRSFHMINNNVGYDSYSRISTSNSWNRAIVNPLTNEIFAICDSNNVALKSNEYQSSWSTVTLPQSVQSSEIACSPSGKYVITTNNSSNIFCVNTNGTWTTISAPATSSKWKAITCNPITGMFVALNSSGGNFTYSYDCISWNTLDLSYSGDFYCITCSSITGMFVALMYNTNRAIYSYNGTSWYSTTLPETANWEKVTCSPVTGRFMGVSSDRKVVYSDDGRNWSSSNLSSSVQLGNICCNISGNFLITSKNSTEIVCACWDF